MKKIVGIVLPVGQNRKRLLESGQWSLWESELAVYKKLGWKHELFEYQYIGPLRFFESLLFPFLRRKRLLQCDILQAVHLSGSIPCLVARILYGKPFILRYAYRYDEFARIEKKWFQWVAAKVITQFACRMARAVMVPTESMATFVRKNGAKYVVVIPNGVDTKLFRPALKGRSFLSQRSRTMNDEQRTINVLFVGRFEPQKNLVALINAIHLIQTEGSDLSKRSDPFRHSIQHPQAPNSKFRKTVRDRVSFFGKIVLTLIGRGSEQKVLENTAQKLRVSLKIIPPVPNDRLASFYHQADIFVLPSLVEGHPKALLEAMSCGLPVVASDIPGCTDIITDEMNGLLVDPSIEGIRRGIEQLLAGRSFSTRLGKQARVTMIKRFEKRRVLKQEVQLMNELTYQ